MLSLKGDSKREIGFEIEKVPLKRVALCEF